MSDTIDFGIDLGTTNSSVAVCRHGDVKVFQTTDLMNVTPSVVYVSRSGRMLVGRRAYDTWVADPDNTQAEFKRWMGFNDTLPFPASGKRLSAVELSAEVLKSLRADAERTTQETLTASVITVPAAFGSLQCDATAKAAKMAGFEQSPLLQEPIAAAVAYGASPASRDQRWMVFDLGGGTLDIAIVSTRDGRLAVLEHQGNNRLGGKDVDRAIAEQMIWAPLAATFKLPDPKADAPAYHRLMRAIVRHAEQAKIALSTAGQTTVDVFDVGEDKDGKTIELTLVLKRSDLETYVRPVVEQCQDLVRRALNGARVSAADLDRVLLVGGPTQMPTVRDALVEIVGQKLDHSLDPMTAVSHGAALYASTLERTTTTVPAGPTLARGVVPVQLAYERASGTARSPVAAIFEPDAGVTEIKIDTAGGLWTSGWVAIVDDCGQTEVLLADGKPATRFTLTARDTKGTTILTNPADFTITYMLPMAAPPLPHTMAIELSTTNGVTRFDPVFARHIPLPAEARKTYTADRTLRPSDVDATLPIKFWEIEVSDDPQEKWWAGCVHVRADQIKRPIPEGSELELTIKIDISRKITVELFVPILNQSFNRDVYIPDPPASRSQLQQQLDLCFERLNNIRSELYGSDHLDLIPRFEQLEVRAETIAERLQEAEREAATDPDASAGPTADVRKLRIQIAQIEEQMGIGSTAPTLARKLRADVPYIERMVRTHGNESEIREFERLSEQYIRFREGDDARGLKWVRDAIWSVHWSVVEDQRWYWEDRFEALKTPGRRFLNTERATTLLAQGESARTRNDLPGIRSACRAVWALVPPDQAEAAREQESASGLRMG
jgi:molecular chaperone DnaK